MSRAGTGFRVLELAHHGHTAIGVDIDPNLCRLANGAATQFGVPATLVCGDACRVPLADASFDVVMSNSFFEHVYDVDVALSEQLRLLKPGGLLIIEDGNLLEPGAAVPPARPLSAADARRVRRTEMDVHETPGEVEPLWLPAARA